MAFTLQFYEHSLARLQPCAWYDKFSSGNEVIGSTISWTAASMFEPKSLTDESQRVPLKLRPVELIVMLIKLTLIQ